MTEIWLVLVIIAINDFIINRNLQEKNIKENVECISHNQEDDPRIEKEGFRTGKC